MGTETNCLKSELLYSDVAERRTAALTAVPEAQP